MADLCGPGKPGSTPSTSTPNSSGSVPAKTVRAMPFIPGRKSSTGKRRESLVAPGLRNPPLGNYRVKRYRDSEDGQQSQ